jgi:hypothetical protein
MGMAQERIRFEGLKMKEINMEKERVWFVTTPYFARVLRTFQERIHGGKKLGFALNDLLFRGIEATIEDKACLFALTEVNQKYRTRFVSIEEAKDFFSVDKFEEIKKEYRRLVHYQRNILEDEIGLTPLIFKQIEEISK